MDIIIIITNLSKGDINDFCELEELCNNMYVDFENKSVEITNPTDSQLQTIPSFSSHDVKIKGSHIDKMKLVEKQIRLKSYLL